MLAGLHAGQVEVTDLDAPMLVHQQVGRLEVAVDDLLCVQLQHALRHDQPAVSAKLHVFTDPKGSRTPHSSNNSHQCDMQALLI